MRKLRYVIGSMDVGGAEKHLLYILPRLKAMGWNIKVILLNSRGALADELETQGVPVVFPNWLGFCQKWPQIIRFPVKLIVSLARLISEFIKDRQTPVHFFLPESVVLGLLAAIITNLPAKKIMSRRSMNNYQQRRPILGWIERKLHRFLDCALGNSKAVTDQLLEEGIDPDKIGLIYNGIDEPNKTSVDIRKNMRIAKDTLVLTIVANLIPYKGHQDLLQALSSISAKLPEWRLLCIGNDRGILNELQQQAAHLNIDSRVKWLQDVKEVAPFWQATDIGLLTSHEEGFSNAILEAMSQGVPMIVTDVGGNAEAVLNDKSGLVVPAGEPVKLAAAIHKLASNPELRGRFGKQARDLYMKNYTAEKCVNSYNEFYQRL